MDGFPWMSRGKTKRELWRSYFAAAVIGQSQRMSPDSELSMRKIQAQEIANFAACIANECMALEDSIDKGIEDQRTQQLAVLKSRDPAPED